MKLPALAVRHPVTTLMVFVALFVMGLVSLSRLGLELLPDISFPTAVVVTPYAGVGPAEIETTVTKPLEDAVSTLNGVERISSTSSEGLSLVAINFSWSTNMDTVVSEIREAVTRVEGQLPAAAERPRIIRYNPEYLPSIVLSVSSAAPGLELRRLAEQRIVPALEKLEGVATVQLFGGRIAAVTCRLDLDAMAKLGVPVTRVLRIFEGENVNLPAGSISLRNRYLVLRTLGEFETLKDIEDVQVGYADGAAVPLGRVARVGLDHLPREEFYRARTADGVQLAVRKQPGHNTVEINQRVRAAAKRLRGQLPPSVQVEVQSDQSRQILNSVGSVAAAAWQGGLLAILVLLLFLRSVPSTLIIAVAIPVSVVSTFSLMDFAGISMNIVSMMGLTLGVGMFVDNSIVVLESSYRKTLAGLPPLEAAVEGTSEVSTAITASTVTTLAVFFPLVFVRDFAGLIFRDMAYTVSFALFISLVMALTLVPVMCARFLHLPRTLRVEATGAAALPGPPSGETGGAVPAPPPGGATDALGRGFRDLDVSLADVEVRTGSRFLDRLAALVQGGLRRLDAVYEQALRWALGHVTAVIVAAVVLLALSVGSVALLGMEFFPETDEGQFAISLETRIGSSFDRTAAIMEQSERIVREVAGADLESLSASIGRGGTMRAAAQTGSHLGYLEAQLVGKDRRRRTVWQIMDTVARRLRREVLDARFSFRLQGVVALASTATGETDPLVLRISGEELERMNAYALELARLLGTVPGVRDAELSHRSGKPELQFRIRQKEAASLGLSPLEIAATLRTAYKGTRVSSYSSGEDKYDVYLILQEQQRNSLEEMRKLFFVNPAGEQIPLENVVEVVEGSGPLVIQRSDRSRVVEVTAGLSGGRPLSRVMQDVQRGVQGSLAPPPGLSLSHAGSYGQMRESFRSLLFVLLLAVALVYMVLASQFESFLHPFLVMFSVPFSVIGLVLALVATHTTFSMMSFMGAILLIGIVVNNAIVLIDYMNRLQQRGLSVREAVLRGGKTRLKPILMTSFTTIFGLLPMALGFGAGSEVRAPLGRAVVGGLLTSSFVTLLLIPTLYWLVETRLRRRG